MNFNKNLLIDTNKLNQEANEDELVLALTAHSTPLLRRTDTYTAFSKNIKPMKALMETDSTDYCSESEHEKYTRDEKKRQQWENQVTYSILVQQRLPGGMMQ